MYRHPSLPRIGSPRAAALPLVALMLTAGLAGGCGGAERRSPVLSTSTAAAARTTASVTESTSTAAPAPVTQTAAAPVTRPPAPAPVTRPPAPELAKPPIVWDPIPFGPERRAQMTAYALRHYGLDTYKLVHPHVIVIHFTETPDFQSTYNTFAPDTPDTELHELPNTCAHFVIDRDGIIHQLVALDIMCRHTVGLNWTAIGIEHVGYSDQQVLDDRRQMSASLLLVHWLRCSFHIQIRDVIGHNESLSSPYHHEAEPALRTQTHSDFNHADMQIYRERLRALGACPRE
jgi:N-acetylmuramoyl-L-alanine amidase